MVFGNVAVVVIIAFTKNNEQFKTSYEESIKSFACIRIIQFNT